MTFQPAPQTVEDLLGVLTSDDVKAYLLAFLTVPQNPVTDWEAGAVLRTMWELEALLTKDLLDFQVAQAKQGYPDTATGESLIRIARGWYGLDPASPSVATQTVVLACSAGRGPYSSAQVAALVGADSGGLTYRVTAGGSISSGGTTTVTMTADTPGLARTLVSTLVSTLEGLSVAGASIATPGSDGDGDPEIAAAIAARLPPVDQLPTVDRLVAWALMADPSITRFRRDADPAIPGGVLLTLANAGGGVSGGTVTAVQALLDKFSPITDNNTAQAASTVVITASGTVTARASLIPSAKKAADKAWLAYNAGSPIGAKVYLEKLRQVVGDAIKADPRGNFTTPALSGAGGDGNVTLASTQVPITPGGDGDHPLTSELTWVGT